MSYGNGKATNESMNREEFNSSLREQQKAAEKQMNAFAREVTKAIGRMMFIGMLQSIRNGIRRILDRVSSFFRWLRDKI